MGGKGRKDNERGHPYVPTDSGRGTASATAIGAVAGSVIAVVGSVAPDPPAFPAPPAVPARCTIQCCSKPDDCCWRKPGEESPNSAGQCAG